LLFGRTQVQGLNGKLFSFHGSYFSFRQSKDGRAAAWPAVVGFLASINSRQAAATAPLALWSREAFIFWLR
jgi:hypothetical protein